ncbi:uncharacterized protein LOC120083387 [Benincasa hispida]|uniref:uncharacterized protein LOC120083387 n=1 Tax=Benincasa hispida TaxID=102211 RepID=UPI0018FFC643|nr:uncharacterized protein LOC120083387 [Benincasa hispida]XP_038895058.1 uncharacterized protein LOC120083387 [Benincasa hispida]
MGCCVSTTRASNSSSSPHHSRSTYSHPKLNRVGNRAPPPLEEESVKEVLSETPKPRPTPIGERNPDESASGKVNGRIHIHPTEEISEVSDVCSFSETLSTTTVTEKLDDFEEIRQRICRSPAKLAKNRSPSDDWVPRRDRMVGKSPTRKSDQSPSRLNGGAGTVKLVQSRDMGQGLTRRSPRPEPHLQNRTENAYRRSRSPAYTRTDSGASRTAAGRSPSVRRSGMSPGREATAGRDYYRKEAGQSQAIENATIEGKWRTTNESLDNPLVSLECFIFL